MMLVIANLSRPQPTRLPQMYSHPYIGYLIQWSVLMKPVSCLMSATETNDDQQRGRQSRPHPSDSDKRNKKLFAAGM